MKKVLLLMIFAVLIGSAQAQDRSPYVGIGGAYFLGATTPLLTFQLGTPVSDALELRATIDTIFSVNVIGADLLFGLYPSDAFKVYLGAGPDVIFVPGEGTGFEGHATAGVEFRLEDGEGIGIFAESKLFLRSTFAAGTPGLAFRGGINFHF
jgi:hypothetical protein